MKCIVQLESDELNGLPDGRSLLGYAYLERPMAVWTVVWNPSAVGVRFVVPGAVGGFARRKKKRPVVVWACVI